MNFTEQQTEFLGWKVIPARLDATQTAWSLGFDPNEVPVLVGAGLLKPLGHPTRNSTKFFATEILEQLRHDEKWLARAGDAIASYWLERNDGRIDLADGRTLDAGFREFLPGYAVTSYGSQGKTLDFVLFSDSAVRAATDRRQWSISRGRHGIRIFTPDKEQLRENVIRSGNQPLALDLVAGRVPEFVSHRAGGNRWRGWLRAWSARAQTMFHRIWQTTKKPLTQDQVYGQQTT